MKRISATALMACLFLATSASARDDSGLQSGDQTGSGAHSIKRAILISAESRDGDAEACRASCDEAKATCNERCVGVTAGSCFARCVDEQEACHLSCGGESKRSNYRRGRLETLLGLNR
jgi:hypothetical protein